tara:strand:+ start:12739 stop:12885 length:147 start_codon:yes stop_codon:yes gene_type:complete
MINQIIENILESNSNSILIIFGDHGPLKKEPKYLFPYDGLKFEDFLYE